jgi:hypothetical protein
MEDWVWDGWNPEDSWCENFKEDGMGTAFHALGIRLDEDDNKCFSATHYDSPIVILDKDDQTPAKADQYYHPFEDPNKEKKRVSQFFPTNMLPTPASGPGQTKL